jgi:DNA-binding SARP family transcriptional activator
MLDEQIIARTRILSDYDAADVAALRAAEPLVEPVHQLLFITDAPEQRWQSRLATTARLGSPLEIATVVIGAWPYGATLSVAADGTITGLDDGDRDPDGDGGRIAVLDTGTAVQMLTMLREAHGDAPPTAAPSTVDQPAEDAATPPTPGLHDTPSAAGTDGEPAAPSSTPTTPAGAPTGTPVRVRILGPAAVLNTDGTAAPELRAKSLELLVYLAVHRRGASREDILEAVFGDVAQRRAPAHLYTCASTLRGVIRTAAAPASATAAADHDATDNAAQRTPAGGNHAKRQKPTIDPVVNTDGHYQLDPALVTVDWWTVLDQYTATATATNDADRLTHLRAAITAAGGGLAEGANYDWIDTDREDTRRHLIKIYAQAAALSTDTDPHQARAYSDLACGLDPLSDELARRAMRAAARVGDTDAITRRLAALRRELDQAGIDLDPGTEDLAVDLLRDLTNP